MQKVRKGALPAPHRRLAGRGVGHRQRSATSAPDAAGEHAATADFRGGEDPYFLSGPMTTVRTYLSRGLNIQAMSSGTFTPAEAPVTIRCPGRTGSCLVA